MCRILPAALICLFAVFPAFAQRGGHGGGGHSGGGMRGGVSVHSGGVGMRSGGVGMRGGGFGHGGGFRGGFGNRPFRSGFGFRRFSGIYPAFYGGFGYYDPFWYDSYSSPYSYPYAGDASDYSGYQGASSPPVVINQDFQPEPSAPAVLREYVAPGPPAVPPPVQRNYGEALYLIAFNDGMIRAVVAYWAEKTSLHYVTMDHVQKQAPLASIDRALSERLNSERNIPFQLPR